MGNHHGRKHAPALPFANALMRLQQPNLPNEDSLHDFWERVTGAPDGRLPRMHAGLLMISLCSEDSLRPDEKNRVLGMSRPQLDGAVSEACEDEAFSAMAQLLSELFDADADGAINFEEMVCALVVLADGTLEEKAEASFIAIDRDGDGVLSKSDLTHYMRHLWHVMCRWHSRKMHKRADEEVARIWEAANVQDGHGISKEAFLTLMEQQPELFETWSLTAKVAKPKPVDPREPNLPRTPITMVKPQKAADGAAGEAKGAPDDASSGTAEEDASGGKGDAE